jgi:hypothetical protein
MKTTKDIAHDFDQRFGHDGPDSNSDSIGRKAGCDDCFENIKLRQEHKEHLISLIESERAGLRQEIMREVRIGNLDLSNPKGWEKGYNDCLVAVLALIDGINS